MKKFLGSINKLTISICEIVFGIMLLIDKVSFALTVVIILGIVLLIAGVVSIISYFRSDPFDAMKKQNFAKGLIEIGIGIFCVMNNSIIVITFPILAVLYGIGMLVSGIFKLQWTMDLIRLKRSRWWVTGLTALFTIICSAFIIANPFTTTDVLWTFIAVTLIISAVLDCAAGLMGIKSNKENNNDSE